MASRNFGIIVPCPTAASTITLYINIGIYNSSSYGYQGNNTGFYIYDMTDGITVFNVDYLDEFSGVYSTSTTLTVGHQYYYDGYMGTPDTYAETVFAPSNGFYGAPTYTLTEDCWYWDQNYGRNYGYFNVDSTSGGDMYFNGYVFLNDTGPLIDVCNYPPPIS